MDERRDLKKAVAAAAGGLDPWLVGAVLGLSAIGLVMVYSSSAVLSQDKLGDSFFYFKRQLAAFALGLLAMAVALKLGYRRLARLAYPALLVAVVLLVLVLIPGIGTAAGGARRWIRLPGFSLQPSELAKLVWVVYLAYSLAKKREKVATFSIGFLPHMALAAVFVALAMLQPDFGTALGFVFLLFVLLFTAGAKLTYLVGTVLAAIPFAYHAVVSQPYRMRRVLGFLDPWSNRQGAGYQVAESLISFGSGGPLGLGLGDGRQKLYFLPEAHTDFIFSILGEELGLVGVVAVLLLYGVLVWRGVAAALRAREAFGTYLAVGLTSLIAYHAAVNMCVALGLLPTKGLTLPFISYGGTSLVVMLAASGVLLSVGATGNARAPDPVPRSRGAEVFA